LITFPHHAENRFSIASALNRVFSGVIKTRRAILLLAGFCRIARSNRLKPDFLERKMPDILRSREQ
jgi:hypothetical protein